MKTEKLQAFLEEMRETLNAFSNEERYVYYILKEIDAFYIRILKDGVIDIYYNNAISSMGARVKEDDKIYIFAIMILYVNLSYKIKKTCRKIKNKECKKELRKWNDKLGRLIRKLAINDVRPIENSEQMYSEVFQLFNVATTQRLQHKVDEIGEITGRIVPKEAEELRKIRKVYERVLFEGNNITYYDYVMNRYETIKYTDLKFPYAIFNIYAEAYITTIPWLKDEDPAGQWCPLTPWQVILDFRILLEKYFFYYSEM